MKDKALDQRHIARLGIAALILCLLLGTLLFVACSNPTASDIGKSGQSNAASVSLNASAQNVTYNADPKSVLIRTFHGGGLSGTLELAPNLSIYGDGTFIQGTTTQGKLDTTALQQLLHTIVDTNGLTGLKRLSFADTQDQNSTFLLLTLNGKTQEFMYGSFGNQQESAQDMDEYHRLGNALTAINNAITGPTQPYHGTQFALLARHILVPKEQLTWPLDFSLGQVVAYECSRDDVYFVDQTSANTETSCMLYTIPHNAVLLTDDQAQNVQQQLPQGRQQGQFYDAATGYDYDVTLRPLLPDELPGKALAMFGSAQDNYTAVPLLINAPVPPIPTPTPSR